MCHLELHQNYSREFARGFARISTCFLNDRSKAVSLLQYVVCVSVVSYVTFVLSLFVPHLAFFWGFGSGWGERGGSWGGGGEGKVEMGKLCFVSVAFLGMFTNRFDCLVILTLSSPFLLLFFILFFIYLFIYLFLFCLWKTLLHDCGISWLYFHTSCYLRTA